MALCVRHAVMSSSRLVLLLNGGPECGLVNEGMESWRQARWAIEDGDATGTLKIKSGNGVGGRRRITSVCRILPVLQEQDPLLTFVQSLALVAANTPGIPSRRLTWS